jgi:hypothetical protein
MPSPPALPSKVYLRRKEVEAAVGGRWQLRLLVQSGRLQGVRLPGYRRLHFVRAQVARTLEQLWE